MQRFKINYNIDSVSELRFNIKNSTSMNLSLYEAEFISLWHEWTSQGMKNEVPCGKLATTKAAHPEI